MARVLAVGDIHLPATHPNYLKFCHDLYDKWKCDRVHLIGDIIDHHVISFHAAHPEAAGGLGEFEQAYAGVREWYEAFPEATVSIGNHDARPLRLAESSMINAKFLRNYSDVWDTPGWTWEDQTIIDDVLYTHGVGFSGNTPALNCAKANGMSAVLGHVHSAGGVHWAANPRGRVAGLDLGCGVDIEHISMAYGKHFPRKPVLSAGIIIDGTHFYHEIMACGPGEPWARETKRKLPTRKPQVKTIPNLLSPEGQVFSVTNQASFAAEHNLVSGSLSRLINGQYKTHRGWTLA